MKDTSFRSGRLLGVFLLMAPAAGMCGCDGALSAIIEVIGDGVTIVIDRPTECFQEGLVETDCFTQETLVTVCEEDFFGFEECFDELVFEVVCEEVLVDTFLICE